MAKKIIRLTEGELHQIIKESISNILKESYSSEKREIFDIDITNLEYENNDLADFIVDNENILPIKVVKAIVKYDIFYDIVGYDSVDPHYDIVDINVDFPEVLKKIIPGEWHDLMIQSIKNEAADIFEEKVHYNDEPDYDAAYDEFKYRNV